MKLKDYFQDKKEFTMSESQKLALYEKILSKNKKRSFFHVFKIKSLAYSFIIMILFVGIYGVYFFNGDYDGLITKNPVNQVNADFIAKVVDFNGNFYIQRDGKIFKSSNISNGDNIILKKGSDIVFDINSGTKAKITGPARFSLYQNDSEYQILIAEGDFIQMESSQPDQAPMEVIINDFTVSSQNNINLLITKKDNEYKIDNQGDNIKVIRNNDTTEVKTKELLAINEHDITLIQNVEEFQTAFVENKINQTFEIQEEQDTQKITENLIKEISTGTVQIQNTGLAQDLGIIDSKQIPTEEQSKVLYSALDKTALMRNLENMREYRNIGNQPDYYFSKSQIDTKIQKLYSAFGIPYQKLGTKADIQDLIQNLQDSYHIPNTQISNLKTLINWIDYIENLPVPHTQTNENSEDNENKEMLKNEIEAKRTEFENNLPSNLILY